MRRLGQRVHNNTNAQFAEPVQWNVQPARREEPTSRTVPSGESWIWTSRAWRGFVAAMQDREEQARQADLIARLFALMTGKLEDAAGIATDGQGRRPPEQLLAFADELETLVSEVATMCAAASALLKAAHSAGRRTADDE